MLRDVYEELGQSLPRQLAGLFSPDSDDESFSVRSMQAADNDPKSNCSVVWSHVNGPPSARTRYPSWEIHNV